MDGRHEFLLAQVGAVHGLVPGLLLGYACALMNAWVLLIEINR